MSSCPPDYLPTSRRALTTVGLQFSGYAFPGTPDSRLFEHLTAVAQTAERSGFDSLWTMDHVHQIASVGEPDDPILEAYTTIAALTAVTREARLGVLVSAGGFRNPALLAKMVTTVDVLSQGRALLGLGAGWLEEEYAAYGIDFPPIAERLERLRDTVRICRGMFTSPVADVAGTHHRVAGAINVPEPLTPGGPPILIGGSGENTLIPMVARLADGCNFYGGTATVRRKIEVLARACEAVGRDPATITKTWLGAAVVAESENALGNAVEEAARRLNVRPEAVRMFNLCGTPAEIQRQAQRLRDAGVDGLIVTMYDIHDLAQVERVGRLLREVMGV